MRRPLAVPLALVLLVAGAASPAVGASTLTVTGYAQEGDATPSDITRDGRYVRTVAIAGVTLDGPDRITAVSDDAHQLRRAAHRHGRKAVLLVSNYSDALRDFDQQVAHQLLTSPEARAAVVQALVQAATGFDGVEIDLESLEAGDRDGLVAFTRELRAALPAKKAVSMAFAASGNESGYREHGYDLPALAPSLDRMVLMGYDQHGPSWSGPGPVGSLPWVERELRYFVKVLPNRKIDLGIGAYGYQWGGTPRTLSVAQARKRAGDKARWSTKHGEWSAKLSGGRTIWWSDKRSVRAREKIAKASGVHGVAIWQIGSSSTLR